MAIDFPDNPSVNDTHTVLGRTWKWNGESWKVVGSAVRGISLRVSDTAPSDPAPVSGDMWYESDTGRTFTYYDSTWVELGNTASVTSFLSDADADTRIHVEESADEDTIRFDTAGTERMTISSTGAVAMTGNLTIDGDLTVSGTTTTLNTTELLVEDNKITLNSGATGSATVDAGIEVERGDDANVEILWDETADAWKIATDFTVDAGTLHVDSTNNRVGIGTTSPVMPIDFNAPGSFGARMRFEDGTTETSGIQFTANGSAVNYATQPFFGKQGLNDSDPLGIWHSNAWRMVVNSSGNVGIGTTSPGQPLQVAGNIYSNTGKLMLNRAGSDNGQTKGGIDFQIDGSLYARMYQDSAGKITLMRPNGSAVFQVVNDYNYSSYQTASIWITSGSNTNGHLYFGQQGNEAKGWVVYGNNTNEMQFGTSGTTRFWINNTGIVHPHGNGTQDLGASTRRWKDIYATNTSIQTSDVRDKTNIADVDYGLDFINGLRPVTYTWDDRNGYTGTRTHMGFVAQEVAELMGDEATNRAVWINSPSVDYTDSETGEVTTEPDSQGLRYAELMAPMVKAIQELTARIEALEAG